MQNTIDNLELYYQGINDNGRYTFDYWLALDNDTPFGFLITSPVTGPYDPKNDYNKWFIEGKSTWTLDILIGPQEYLGKGLATPMIKNFILDQFPHADYFIIDPEKSNSRAIHVYEKVGFETVAEFHPDYNPKPHIMMRLAIELIK